jgi:DNA-binding transcriptional MocR family regulator
MMSTIQRAPKPASTQALLPAGSGNAALLSETLAARFAEQIAQGLLTQGARLPSVRDCARRHAVSPSTVVSAYDQLQARGLVEARKQRGFFVRERRAGADPAAGAHLAPGTKAMPGSGAPGAATAALAARPRPVDATALIRGMFAGASRLAGPGSGTLPEQWLDAELLQRALRKAAASYDGGLRYGEPAGDERLRHVLVGRLADIGIRADVNQIATTLGATHALDIVARTLLSPGDAVLVDEPGWAVEFARLTRMGMRLLPVPRGPDGPDLVAMAHLARQHKPKLYVTVSVLHNPTGCSLPLAGAHQVLKLAEAEGFTIVEDDTYSGFAPTHAPRLAALDGLARTLYISGFSKILAPNWRVGFMAAAPGLIERLVDTKMISTLTTPALLEQAVAWCLEQGLLRRHAERVGDQLDVARHRTRRLAEAAGCRFVTPPQGLFGWVDTGVDTDALAIALLDGGWLMAPGSLFHAERRPRSTMRINFATTQDARFWNDFQQARERLLAPR